MNVYVAWWQSGTNTSPHNLAPHIVLSSLDAALVYAGKEMLRHGGAHLSGSAERITLSWPDQTLFIKSMLVE